MATVDELVEQLKDSRTRSAAKDALVGLGGRAVRPLLGALRSRNVSVRWSAASILGELSAREAIPELVEALNDPHVHSAAVEALQHITGEELGDDYDAWKRWVELEEGEREPSGAPTVELESDGDLVRRAVDGTEVTAEKRPHGYMLRVPVGERHQDVFVNFRARDSDGGLLVAVYTRCGAADPKQYEWALRQNLRMSAGAVAVTDLEGKPHFVIVDVLVRAVLTPGLILETVRRVARKGDQLESALSSADRY